MKNKILISTYYFFPENRPRAFRAFELAKEFSDKGYLVTIVIPDNDFDYKSIENKYSLKIVKVKAGIFLNKKRVFTDNISLKKNKIKKLIKKMLYPLYFEGIITEYFLPLYWYFIHEREKYDKVISIGLPFVLHLSLSLSRSKNNLGKTYIADYGDPFSFNNSYNKLFYMKIIEKKILKNFDFITVPVTNAKQAFSYFNVDEKIFVIPQGFNFDNVNRISYKKNKIVTFSFAGNFYEDIRNPKILFDYLTTVKKDFRFILFIDLKNSDNIKCLSNYKQLLGDKLIINSFIPREDLIYKLSGCDFLINIENDSLVQVPSKLIDYKLSNRPIFSFSQNNFDEKLFKNFLNYKFDYDYINCINLEEYNIENVVKKFEVLNVIK